MEKKQYYKEFSGRDYWVRIYIDLFNERVRLDDYRGNLQAIVQLINEVTDSLGVSKIILIAKQEHLSSLLETGYVLEAIFQGFFNGSDAYFCCSYKTQARRINQHFQEEDQLLKKVQGLQRDVSPLTLPPCYQIQNADESKVEQLANLYSTVFKVYPVPMHDPDYIAKAMRSGTVFKTVNFNGNIVSAASAELNLTYHNAELTDCATHPEHRKKGLMKLLLMELEQELKSRGIFSAYSIARALSFGMNAAFHQLGYRYTGRLINNVYIYDKLEDMNVWVKDLSAVEPNG